MTTTLILGAGEVGIALNVALSRNYLVEMHDPLKGILAPQRYFSHLHVTFPYSGEFMAQVREYQERFRPEFTIIHSTVPVGISRQLNAIHSPIRGLHPHLAESIQIFPKFLGGTHAPKVADYFRKAGIKVILVDHQETSEALKLFDTEYYRVCIEFCQRVKKYCDGHNLNFHEVYTLGNLTYNDSYDKLGYPEFTRPVLQPMLQEIGGHCIRPNQELIKFSETP